MWLSRLSVPAFWTSTLLWLFPWFLFLPSALLRGRGWSRKPRFGGAPSVPRSPLALAWIWSGGIVLFFTLTGSRMEYYALPAYPALSVILASAWRRFVTSGRQAGAIRVASLVVGAIGLAVVPLVFLSAASGSAALTGLVTSLDGYYREYFVSHPGASLAFGAELLRKARPFPIVLLLLGVGSLLSLRMGRRRQVFAVWVAALVPVLFLADAGMRLVASDRSQAAAASIVNRNWTPGARLVVAGDYEDACGITFYTGRPTQVLGGPGADLLFGLRRGDAPEVFLAPEDFWKTWGSSSDPVFVLGSRDLMLPGASILLETSRYRLLSSGAREASLPATACRKPPYF